jgi:membrane-bound lytic murein transglycosylase B
MKKTTVAALALGGLMAMSGLAQAAECGNSAKGFNTFLKGIKAEAAAAGVGARGLSALDGVEYQPGIIKKDRAQSVFSQSFLQFQARMVSDRRITTGQAMMKKHKATFDAVQ